MFASDGEVPTPPADGVREIRVLSFDKVPDEMDSMYDFRPIAIPADVEEDATPKDSSVTTPAVVSDSPKTSEQEPETTVSVPTVKSPVKAAASKNGSQTS